MKKKVLFVIESLACAGGEKSLTTLLNLFDYEKYEVDLQLFRYGGELQQLIPKTVKILPPLRYFEECEQKVSEQAINCVKSKQNIKEFICRIKYSVLLRRKKLGSFQQAILFWKCSRKCFINSNSNIEYDVAVAYAQGTPTFYVADCVKAKKKIAWINAIYSMNGEEKIFSEEIYSKFDKISCVSEVSKDVFGECFPNLKKRLYVTKDINDGKMIEKMSEMYSLANEEMRSDKGEVKILTVGRFAYPKGYDIAVEACSILEKRGIIFKWFVLGKGPFEEQIKKDIIKKNVEEYFILLGVRANPYPYFKNCDIYVQTSRVEGFGLTIAEARTLNKPVVTTRFDAVFAQMIDGKNGLVVDMNAESVANGVQKLIENRDLYDYIKEFQSHEKKSNYEELDRFYQLIE